MPADILIYALVAAGLVFWLRSILGTRHGDEPQRPNLFTSSAPEKTAGQAAPVTNIPSEQTDDFISELEKNMSIGTEAAEQGLVEIARADRQFNLLPFLKGTQDAFIIIIESFSAGDRETLGNLLTAPVYKSFDTALTAREKSNEQSSIEIHAIRRTEVVYADLKGKSAFVTIRFVADETSVTRDADDKIISGDPDRVTETIDLWTFTKETNARDPRWLVCETREDDEDEISGSTVPETDNK